MKDRRIRCKRSPIGFTLVELLVVVAIIGILVALLLPAVQAAREAARRVGCQNNLHNLGIALHNYQEAHKIFPPSSHWKAGVSVSAAKNPNLSENWVIMTLPFMEGQNLFDKFDRTKYITNAANATARGTRLEVMMCPSDANTATPFNGTKVAAAIGDNWARGNYAANASLSYMAEEGSVYCGMAAAPNGCGAKADSKGWKKPNMRGVMGANTSLSLRKILDGTSNTVLLGEIRAGINEIDGRGVWAMSGACPSALWGHGWLTDANGPNNALLDSDDVNSCLAIAATVGGQQALAQLGMPCSSCDCGNIQQGARSMHVGGVFMCFCDGSVRFISDFVQLGSGPNDYGVWDKINASCDALLLDETAF